MGPKKWPVAEAYWADFHAPSVVSISGAFARIQGSDTCLAGCGRHKSGCRGGGGGGPGGWGGQPGEGDAQQGLIQLPLPKPPHLEASLQPCLSPPEVRGSHTALRHTAGESWRKGRESSRSAAGWGCQRHPRRSPNTPLGQAPCHGSCSSWPARILPGSLFVLG